MSEQQNSNPSEVLEPSASVDTAAAAPTWDDLGLSDAVLAPVKAQGYKNPTPVQAKGIPVALDGRDLIASAQTGTGKTACFVLPMVERFKGREGTYGLVLAPTREIAQQIEETIRILGGPLGIRSAVLIGGVDMRLDAKALATYPQIIVATPGRLVDHLERGNLWLDFIEMTVLDEADRMLDMGFSTQINRIFDDLPKTRQTMLFSATFPPSVESLAKRVLTEPERVTIGRTNASAATVEQRMIWVREDNKGSQLKRLIDETDGSVIVFTRSKDLAQKVFLNLHRLGVHEVTYISSDRAQSQREEALAKFKDGTYRVMVATDVASRGLHIEAVAHVINYDLPMNAEDYVHRIGRTGRAGASGLATSLVYNKRGDREILAEIERLIKRRIPSLNGDPRELERQVAARQPDQQPKKPHRRHEEPRAPRAETIPAEPMAPAPQSTGPEAPIAGEPAHAPRVRSIPKPLSMRTPEEIAAQEAAVAARAAAVAAAAEAKAPAQAEKQQRPQQGQSKRQPPKNGNGQQRPPRSQNPEPARAMDMLPSASESENEDQESRNEGRRERDRDRGPRGGGKPPRKTAFPV